MITIKTENHNPISQDFYDKIINSLDLDLITCPCGHTGCLIRYGSYQRKVQLQDTIISLFIVRVYCNTCRHTHALLLSSMVPYSQVPLDVQLSAISAYEHGKTLSTILDDQCCIDENNLRSIIRVFRLHWKQRLLSAFLTLSDLNALVDGCFLHFSRQFMQIKTTTNKLFLIPT